MADKPKTREEAMLHDAVDAGILSEVLRRIEAMSKPHKAVYRMLGGDSSNYLREFPMNGKFLDLYDPITNVAIEIDFSPRHFWEKKADRARDEFLFEKKGVHTIRITPADLELKGADGINEWVDRVTESLSTTRSKNVQAPEVVPATPPTGQDGKKAFGGVAKPSEQDGGTPPQMAPKGSGGGIAVPFPSRHANPPKPLQPPPTGIRKKGRGPGHLGSHRSGPEGNQHPNIKKPAPDHREGGISGGEGSPKSGKRKAGSPAPFVNRIQGIKPESPK